MSDQSEALPEKQDTRPFEVRRREKTVAVRNAIWEASAYLSPEQMDDLCFDVITEIEGDEWPEQIKESA